MLEKIQEIIEQNQFHVYDLAIMTENGPEEIICTPSNRLNNSYSVAKLFINTAIGMLIDAGKLHLQDQITDLLRPVLSFPYDNRWDGVTLRHALSHTMGLEHGCFDVDRDDPAQYQTPDYLRYILSQPPTHTPGEFHLYTDVPHYLLSRVISQVTGRPADEMILENLCNPLQFYPPAFQRCPFGHTIGSTGAFVRAQDLAKLAWLYQNHGQYQGKTLLSESWIQTAEAERFDLYPMRQGDFIGKAGINGQMLAYSRKKRLAVAWHGFEPNEKALRQTILNTLYAI